MYFQAFRREAPPAIPQEVMFTVEYLVSQILTTADQRIVEEPDNKALREQLCHPVSLPPA